MQRNCRTAGQNAAARENPQGRSSVRARAEAVAAAVIAQGRQGLGSDQEEPMNRYIHPIPISCPQADCGADTALLERMLETLCYQNQLLLDLLAAVNALTAATLNARSATAQP